jgi:hypothetical protein
MMFRLLSCGVRTNAMRRMQSSASPARAAAMSHADDEELREPSFLECVDRYFESAAALTHHSTGM